MGREVLVTDPSEIGAVISGALPGTQYRDGEVYADEEALQEWRGETESQAHEQPENDKALDERQ